MRLALLASVFAFMSATMVPAYGQAPLVIKYSHVNTENTPKGQQAVRFKELAEKYLGNKVKVEVYPSSTLFGDDREMEALLLNDVQIIAPSLSKFGRYTDKLQVFDLPFLFQDVDAVTRFENSPIGQDLLKSVSKRGYTGLAYLHNGMKQMTAKRKLVKPEDAKGARFRIQHSEVIEAQFKAIGAVPVKLAFSEVYQALQTGVVDGQENSWTSIFTMKFFEVQPHIIESNHGMMSFMVTVSSRWWEKLPADIRQGLQRAIKESTEETNLSSKKMHEDNRKKIVDSGRSTVYVPSAQDLEAWRKAMAPVWTEFEKPIGKELIEAARKSNSK
jgi:C4-dicarboxylate-binding protein DctP